MRIPGYCDVAVIGRCPAERLAATYMSQDGCHAAQHIDLHERQLEGRMEMTRALALPQYEITGMVGAEAKNIVKFSDAQEKALMYGASSLTARSQHLQAMVEAKGGS